MDARARKRLAEYQQKLRDRKQEELVAALEQYVAGWERRLATDYAAGLLIDELLRLMKSKKRCNGAAVKVVKQNETDNTSTDEENEMSWNQYEENEFGVIEVKHLPPRDENGKLIPLRDRAGLLAEKSMLDFLLMKKRVPLDDFGKKNDQERLIVDRLMRLGFVRLERHTAGCEGLKGYELAKALLKQDVVLVFHPAGIMLRNDLSDPRTRQ